MARRTEFTFDPSQVLKMFEEFDEKSRRKVFRSTLKKAAGILVRESKRQLRERIGEAADHPNRWNNKRMTEGIRSFVAKNNRMVKVNIMGDFRLKFFELGTDDRYNTYRYGHRMKKKAYRGSMKANGFFRSAKAATEQKVFSTITKNLVKAIERINKKQHG